MNIWEPEKLILFLSLFMPGFVSIKVYELIVATKRHDFKNSLLEAIGLSVLNFAALSWLILVISTPNFYKSHPVFYSVTIFSIFLVFRSYGQFFLLNWQSGKNYLNILLAQLACLGMLFSANENQLG